MPRPVKIQKYMPKPCADDKHDVMVLVATVEWDVRWCPVCGSVFDGHEWLHPNRPERAWVRAIDTTSTREPHR